MIQSNKRNFSPFLLILFFLFCCDTDEPVTTTVEIPLRLAPNTFIQGDYQIHVSITAADMETVTASAELAGTPGSGISQRLILKDVLVGKNRQVKVQIWRGGDLVSSKLETVNLVKGEVNSFTIKMDKVDRPKIITSRKDNSKMVLIPSGSFEMGSTYPFFGTDYSFEGGKWKINSISEGGSLESAKVKLGDYVLSVNNCVIKNGLDADKCKKNLRVGERLKVVVLRDGQETTLWGKVMGYSDKIQHQVQIDAFYMDAYEVTLGQYKQFLQETGHAALRDWVAQYSPTNNHPVVGVNWHDAVAYANWAGKRLPTEAEWEYAARGGLVGKLYPWGDGEPTGRECNFADKSSDKVLRELDEEYDYADMSVDDGYAKCAPVGSYPPNDYGLYDMAGNVWEWCADWYDRVYYKNSPLRNPQGPSLGSTRVLRGGSWSDFTDVLRAAYRNGNSPSNTYFNLGFRCVSGF